MSHDMFGDVVRPSVKLGSRAWYTVPLSIVVHVAVAAVVIVVPLMATDVLPKPPGFGPVVMLTPPPPPPPPVAPARPDQTRRTAVSPSVAPSVAPSTIVAEPPPPYVPSAGPGVEGGLPAGLVGATGLEAVRVVVPVLPPPPPLPTEPVPVGGRIAVPKKLKDVRPHYPEIARAAKVEGMVIIDATIGADGLVKNARVIKSVPLLDQAALDAVRQWQFSPTRLNGVPIPVIMTVTLNFTLQ